MPASVTLKRDGRRAPVMAVGLPRWPVKRRDGLGLWLLILKIVWTLAVTGYGRKLTLVRPYTSQVLFVVISLLFYSFGIEDNINGLAFNFRS